MEDTIISRRIQDSELLGRTITSEWLNNTFNGLERDLQITPTPIECSVDLKLNLLDPSLHHREWVNIEVKLRKKNQRNIDRYPHGELKIAKYKRMREATDKGVKLYYCVLLDNTDSAKQTLYLWDMDNLQWDSVGRFNWLTKTCEADPLSPTVMTPIYQIPFSQAVWVEDVTDIFTSYGYNLQT